MPRTRELEGTQKQIERVACGAWVKTFDSGVADDPGDWGRVVITKSLIGEQTKKRYTELVVKGRDGMHFKILLPDNSMIESLTEKQAKAAGLSLA
jgi:hypothetical protein